VNKNDYRDKTVFSLVILAWAISTIYLFKFHSDTNFGIWAGLCGTLTGVFHWLCVYDDKHGDA